ncbi:hypothetical protein P171DRAFT_239458 [Karstenula rhodostoma CBS 690.94]|uniref:Zn(2)-C6 fungal-type domain-containing protein n=1 Tax=Karstenula rhodostoma CBS 690.94 TaxID=1392251 RepID=A0A9P4PKL4_9PLEO|nr:hypothetical protein P171DRAFT_239458 [Karstenula rhodostoma CBS 690.94]
MANNDPSQSLLQDLGLPHDYDDMDVDYASAGGQQPLNFTKGLSDDEGLDSDIFEDLFGEISKKRAPGKNKKIPRRLSGPDVDDDHVPQPSPTKTPRITSLFGGPSNMDVDEPSGSGQQRLILSPGLSDDEGHEDDDGMEDLFGPSPTSSKNRNTSKSKKIPRHLSDHDKDDGDTPEPSPTKKARISLFGGPVEGTDGASQTPPQTPGIGLGMRFSSLTLDQQEGQGDYELAASSNDVDAVHGQSQHDDSPKLSPMLQEEEETDRRGDSEVQTYTDDPVESYGLRKNINRQGAASTHIDIDQSGNYDPAEEARIWSVKARMAKQAKQAQKAKKKPNKDNAEAEGERKLKLIFRGKIEAMGMVLDITDNQDNWPDGHSILDTEDEAEREELLALFRKDTPTPTCNLHVADPAGEHEDLTGHPTIRGCKTCRADRKNCSMVSDGEYPCQDCVDNEIECEPILDPGEFGPCNRCVEQGQTCSFENTNGEPQMAMCDECLEADNLDCKARPPRGYKSERIDLDRVHYGEGRKWISCTHCREEKKRCSLKKKTDKPPCKHCKKKKIGCHFYDVTPHEKEKPAKKRKKKKDAEEEPIAIAKPKDPQRTLLEKIAPQTSIPGSDLFSPADLAYMDAESSADDSNAQEDEATEQEIMEDAEGHIGFLTTIKTSFAHPMIFSVEPPGHRNAVKDCNFCDMPVFGMVGHFEREVHTIQWSNGQGYTEFGNGHREGNGATTMCYKCTFHRLQIIVCPNHVVQPMELHEDRLDYDAAAEDLMTAGGGTSQVQFELQRWCSLCFSLATHRCCTPQPSVTANEDEDETVMMDGCGLGLCSRCAHELGQIYMNSLDDMVTALDKEPKPKYVETDEEEAEGASEEGTVRADVGLLKANGLLMMCAQGGEAE